MGLQSVRVAVYFIPMPPQADFIGEALRRLFKYHVAALIMWPECPVFVQPQWSGLLAYKPSADKAHLLGDAPAEYVVTVTARIDSRERFGPDILTCVNVVKRIIGLRDWRVQTPRQLLRALRRFNGTK